MKIVPSEELKKHLLEQNVVTPEGGFDVPDAEWEAEKLLLTASHVAETVEAFEERLRYRVIWKLFGVPANGSQKGVDLTMVQRVEAMRREVAEVVEKHLPNVSADISKATNLGHEKLVAAISDLKTFEGESHAEAIKIKSELSADLKEVVTRYGKIAVGMLGAIIGLLALLILLSHSAHAQGTPVIANQANGAKLHVTCDAGCSSSSSPTIGAAMPSTATPVGGTDGVNFQALHVDGSFNLKINCAVGCAGGATTPSNAFANPTTAGLSMSFNTMWNGTSWDLVKGDTTNGLWVNCKSGCAGGSSTPTDAFANPTTAGLNQGFMMMWNGTTWDRVKGDTTSGLWVNVKAALPAGSNVIGHVIADSGSTTAVTGNVAVTEADGANVTLGAKADAKSTATDTTAVTVMQVLKQISASVQAPPSQAVTNAGTFATQATLSAETTKVIGTVNIAASQTVGLVAGSALVGKVGIDQTTPGTTNGVQVNAALPAGTNLMGKVGIDQTTPGTTNGTQDASTSATGAAPPAKAGFVGYLGSGATGGFLTGAAVGDTYKNINISTATTTLLVTGVTGRQVRISSIHMVTAAANNVALIEGTGATCGTGTAGMAGGTTAASGYNFAANGGMTLGSGLGTVMQTATTGDSVCAVTSAATQLSGGLQYTIY